MQEASILNHTGTSILADAAAGPDIEEVYTSGTGAWAATIANASSSARTLDIQFGRSPGPGVQQVFRNTVVWCAATWGASAQLVAALDTRGQPVLEADVTSAAACTECCGIKVRQGLSRGRTMGLGSLQAATTPAQAFAAVPVDFQGGPMGEALDSQTPSQQSGSSSVPRLVLILPLGIAAIGVPSPPARLVSQSRSHYRQPLPSPRRESTRARAQPARKHHRFHCHIHTSTLFHPG